MIVGVRGGAGFLGGDITVIYNKQGSAVDKLDDLGKKIAITQEYGIFTHLQANCAISYSGLNILPVNKFLQETLFEPRRPR